MGARQCACTRVVVVVVVMQLLLRAFSIGRAVFMQVTSSAVTVGASPIVLAPMIPFPLPHFGGSGFGSCIFVVRRRRSNGNRYRRPRIPLPPLPPPVVVEGRRRQLQKWENPILLLQPPPLLLLLLLALRCVHECACNCACYPLQWMRRRPRAINGPVRLHAMMMRLQSSMHPPPSSSSSSASSSLHALCNNLRRLFYQT